MAKQLATDFVDDIEEELESVDPVPPVGKDEAGIPYCVKHHCQMKQTSGGKKGSAVAYFACPVDLCDEKAKRIKTTKSIVPAEPHLCHRCTAVSPRPIMEREGKLSNAFYTILKCPTCGHKSAPMPRPEFVASHAAARGQVQVDDIGAR